MPQWLSIDQLICGTSIRERRQRVARCLLGFAHSTMRSLQDDGSIATVIGRFKWVNEHSACPGAKF
jgi:hypothetical protein